MMHLVLMEKANGDLVITTRKHWNKVFNNLQGKLREGSPPVDIDARKYCIVDRNESVKYVSIDCNLEKE